MQLRRRRKPTEEHLEIDVVLEGSLWTVYLRGFEHYGYLGDFYNEGDAERLAGVLRQLTVLFVEEGFDIEGFAADLTKTILTLNWVDELGLKL